MTGPVRDRRAARSLGIRAERLAEWWLRLKGFRILARNYRIRDGEIDIVAQRGRLVAFVEVKARPTLRESAEAVTGRKQQRIARAARHWVVRHPGAADRNFRADGVFVSPRRLPRHVPGVFDLAVD